MDKKTRPEPDTKKRADSLGLFQVNSEKRCFVLFLVFNLKKVSGALTQHSNNRVRPKVTRCVFRASEISCYKAIKKREESGKYLQR